jgi:hypothetical protein
VQAHGVGVPDEASHRQVDLADLAFQVDPNLERYRSAAALLSRVTFIDDRARLYHGWSTLHLARAEGDQHAVTRSLAEIDEAMRRWAFASRDPKERLSWERQLERLRDLGYVSDADELVTFASQHARWGHEQAQT